MSTTHDDPRATPTVVLAYRNARETLDLPPARRSSAFAVAVGCWAVPLAVGSWEFVAFVVDPSKFPVSLGVYTMVVGVALSVVGGTAAATFVAGRWQPAGDKWRECVRPELLLLLLLV